MEFDTIAESSLISGASSMYESGMRTDQGFDEDSEGLTQFRRVVDACDEFESAWMAARPG